MYYIIYIVFFDRGNTPYFKSCHALFVTLPFSTSSIRIGIYFTLTLSFILDVFFSNTI